MLIKREKNVYTQMYMMDLNDGFKKQNSKPQPKRNSKSETFWNFPGSLVIKSSCFHCREQEFNPQLRNQDSHVVLACEKKKRNTLKNTLDRLNSLQQMSMLGSANKSD